MFWYYKTGNWLLRFSKHLNELYFNEHIYWDKMRQGFKYDGDDGDDDLLIL